MSRPRLTFTLFLLPALIGLAGCGGSDSTTDETTEASGGGGRLTLTRADGSTYTLGDATVLCGPTSTEKKLPAIYARTTSPENGKPYFQLEAIVADVQENPVVKMPNNYIESDPSGAVLFVYDAKTKNELDSTFEDSRGTITFNKVICGADPEIDFTVDGILDSEFGDGDPNEISGSFELSD